MEMPSPALIFANYQRTIMLQVSSDQNSALQIAELDFLYTRLYRNDCDIPSALRAMTLLSAIPHLWDSISTSILFSHISISDLT